MPLPSVAGEDQAARDIAEPAGAGHRSPTSGGGPCLNHMNLCALFSLPGLATPAGEGAGNDLVAELLPWVCPQWGRWSFHTLPQVCRALPP